MVQGEFKSHYSANLASHFGQHEAKSEDDTELLFLQNINKKLSGKT